MPAMRNAREVTVPQWIQTGDGPESSESARLDVLASTDRSSSFATSWFIANEGAIFIVLLLYHFHLRGEELAWRRAAPPKVLLAASMLALLLASSAVLRSGEWLLKEGLDRSARIAVGLAVLLGIGFLVLEVVAYSNQRNVLVPTTSVQRSILHAIATFHALHLLIGLAMLVHVLLLPNLRCASSRSLGWTLQNATKYWHFVVGIWAVIVAVVYSGGRL